VTITDRAASLGASSEAMPSVEKASDAARPDLKELRVLARLAWNGWTDNAAARGAIAEQEERDAYSARAWDRVVEAILGETRETGQGNEEKTHQTWRFR